MKYYKGVITIKYQDFNLIDVGYDDTKYGFIYLTINKINGKMYIGQKKYDKKKEYRSYLGSGKILQYAIKKYGRENFNKIILYNTKDRSESNEKEKYYIKLFNAVNSENFYNIGKGGDGGYTTYGYTELEKEIYSQHLSKALKGKINQGANNPSSKKVICLNTLKIYDNITIAANENNISRHKLYSHLNGNQKSVKINNSYTIWDFYDKNKIYHKIKESDIELDFHRSAKIVLLKCYEDKQIYTFKEVCENFNITQHQLSCKLYYFKKNKNFSLLSCGILKDGKLYHFEKIGKISKDIISKNNHYK